MRPTGPSPESDLARDRLNPKLGSFSTTCAATTRRLPSNSTISSLSAQSPQERLRSLSLRAQLFWARGERSQATRRHRLPRLLWRHESATVEETPFGLVLLPRHESAAGPGLITSPALASQAVETNRRSTASFPADVFDPRLQFPVEAPPAPMIERGGGPIPFAPFQGRELP